MIKNANIHELHELTRIFIHKYTAKLHIRGNPCNSWISEN